MTQGPPQPPPDDDAPRPQPLPQGGDQPPYPPQQPPYPPQPPGGSYPQFSHWAPENAPPPPPSSGSILIGMLISVIIAIMGFVVMANAPASFNVMSWLPAVVFFLWLGLAVFFTARADTRRTGAGMFIAGGLVPVILAGACVLIIMGLGQMQ